jgi:hypothetical protein
MNVGMIGSPRRRTEEIDDRDLLLHRIQEPPVIRRVRVGARELGVDDIITGIDLAMSLALIVIPDPSAPSGEHRLNAQQVRHLPRLENPALRVDQRNAFTADLESAREIGGIQNPTSQGG